MLFFKINNQRLKEHFWEMKEKTIAKKSILKLEDEVLDIFQKVEQKK